MHKFMCVLAAIILVSFVPKKMAQTKDGTQLTIEAAVNKAIKNNLGLQNSLKTIEVLKAVKTQSGLTPNPELEFEAENILGNKDFRGFAGSELTASISQNILLAGKISKREDIAEADILLAEWDYEQKRQSLITDIRKAFVKSLSTKNLIEKNSELAKISGELILNLHERMKAGKISPAEVSRAQIIMNKLNLELIHLKADYDDTIYKLSSLINDPNLSFSSLAGELRQITEVPVYDSLQAKMENNPILQRYESELYKTKAIITYEESNAIPDLTITAGYKRLVDINANSFVIGASIPLPVFNQNQGSIQAAQIELDKKSIEFKSARNSLMLRLNLSYNRLRTLLNTAQKLKDESIPNAQNTFKIIKQGNQVGRFTILDVLDAERTLIEVQNQYLITLGEINTAIVDIEGIIVEKIN